MHILKILLHNSYVLYSHFFQGRRVSHYDFIEKIINHLYLKGEMIQQSSERSDSSSGGLSL
jgi:dTDP-4-dehydrorhamnose reductase